MLHIPTASLTTAVGTSDSSLFAVSGHQDLTCGEASFAIAVDEDAEPEYNKALSIILEQNGDEYRWLFYETVRGERGYCGNNQVVFKGPIFSDADIDSPPHPSGRYSFDIWSRACEFSGNGKLGPLTYILCNALNEFISRRERRYTGLRRRPLLLLQDAF
jgi:hypothetical protein